MRRQIKYQDRILNFDNAATSFPKPENVKNAVYYALNNLGGNPGRGSHILSSETSEAIYRVRKKAADFFGAKTENVIFCSSCTHALNIVINSIAVKGAHIIISSAEHNSVLRPLAARAEKKQIELSIARIHSSDEETLNSFSSLIRPDTRAVICTAAGNVTGQIPPLKLIAQLCAGRNICFIADGAQACGRIPLVTGNGINFICTSGHKGLFGISGTGLLISDGKYKLEPLITGGTGSGSLDISPPVIMPDSFECGTLNTPGIISVGAGIDFINKININRIYQYEDVLCRLFCSELSGTKKITVYRTPGVRYAPIVSFNINDTDPDEFADYLNDKGFCLRAGYHCSALAHRSLGTEKGTIRFSPSVFCSKSDVKKLCFAIKNAL